MVLSFNKVIFPPEQASKIADAWAEWMKDNPPDPSIEKDLALGVLSTEDGNILAFGIADVMKGKAKESLEYNTRSNLFMASKIPGLKYKTEIILSISEAYKLLGKISPVE